jgi:hypothetical protein
MGVKLITKELIRRKIPSFTKKSWCKKWNEPYVAKILTGESAIGHHQPIRFDPETGKRIPAEKILNLFPAVISERLNSQAKVAMRQRKNTGGRVDLEGGKVHPFSGLLVSHTGAAMWIRYRAVGRKDPKMVPFLHDQSNGNSYPLGQFECYMLGWLAKFEPEPTDQQSDLAITSLEEKIIKLDHKIQTLKDKINSGEQFDSFLELLSRAEKERIDQIRKLEELRAITPSKQGVTIVEGIFERLSSENGNYQDNLSDHTNLETNLELRAVLRRMVKQIKVTIGCEHKYWYKKSLRVSVTFRDGNTAEFLKESTL